MSNIIDERVAKLSFDGESFQTGIGNALTTLGKFQEVIGKANATSLTGLQNAASNVSFEGLESGMDRLNNRFSLLGVAAMTAVQNVVNKAVDGGQRIVSALTIDPVKTGLSEYEEKINSVQTILMGAKNKNGTAVSLQQVKDKLEELNVYADKTIYSFEDMTKNIGKFTNAGVDLDTAVAAIQGISNEAAVSGANANEASRAMYNFAQALSSGAVKLIDWKSIENANMATVEFKQELLDTAVALGTVVKEGDKYKSTTKDNNGKVSEAFNATEKFNDALSSQWMTTEVLTTTLGRYADANTKIGKKAFAAAQEVKTLRQLWDTLKEAAQSGWGQTWEYIIGDFEEAKALWTDVSSYFGAAIDESSRIRNEILKEWHDMGGRDDLLNAFWSSVNAMAGIVAPVKEAFHDIFGEFDAKNLKAITQAVENFTSKLKLTDGRAQKVYDVFYGLFSVLKVVSDGLFSVGQAAVEITSNLMWVADAALNTAGSIGRYLESTMAGLNTKSFDDAINGLIDLSSKIGFTEEQSKSLKNTFSEIGDAFAIFLDGALQTGSIFLNFISGITSALVSSGALYSVMTLFANTLSVVANGLKLFATSSQVVATVISNVLISVIEKATSVITTFANLADIIRATFGGISDVITSTFKGIGGLFGQVSLDNVTSGLEIAVLYTLFDGIKDFFDNFSLFGKDVDKLTGSIKTMFSSFTSVSESISKVLNTAADALEGFTLKVKSEALKNCAVAVAILAASLIVLSGVDSEKIQDSMAALVGVISMLLTVMLAFTKISSHFGSNSSQKGGVFSVFAQRMMGDSSVSSIKTVALVLIEISIALTILTNSVTKLAEIPTEQLVNGLLVVLSLMAGLGFLVQLLPSEPNTKGLIAISAAIYVLSSSIKKISDVPDEKLLNSFVVVLSTMVALGILLQTMPTVPKGSKGVVAISAALYIMSSAIGKISKVPDEKLLNSLLSVLILMAAMQVALRAMPKSIDTKALVSIVVIGEVVKMLGGVVKSMGQLSPEQVAAGVTAIGALIAELTIAISYMSGLNAGADILVGAAAMFVMANALIMVSVAVSTLSGIGDAALGGVLAMAATISVLATGLKALSGISLKGPAALLVTAVALNALLPIFGLFAALNLKQILTAIAGIGGVLLILGVAGTALSTVAPEMLMASLAITAFSASMGVLGLALGTIVGPLGGLVVALAPVGVAIKDFVSSIAALVSNLSADGVVNIVLGLAVAISGLVVACMALSMASGFIFTASVAMASFGAGLIVLGAGLASIIGAFALLSMGLAQLAAIGPQLTNTLSSIGDGIKLFFTSIFDGLGSILDTALSKVEEWGPKLIALAGSLISFLVQGLLSSAEMIWNAAVQLVSGLLAAIQAHLGEFVQNGIDIATTFVQSVAEGIRNNTETITATVTNLFISIGELILSGLAGIVEMIPGIGGMLAEKLNGMKDQIDKGFDENVLKDKTKEATEGAAEGVEEGTAELESSVSGIGDAFNSANLNIDTKALKSKGIEIPESIASGVDSGSGKIDSTLKKVVSTGSVGAIDTKAFTSAGNKDIASFTNALGSSSNKKKANNAGKSVAQSSGKGADNEGTRRDFASAGNHYVSGLVSSITSPGNMSRAYNAGHALGERAKKGYDDATKTMSPSREMYKRGGYFVDGLVNAITHFSYKAERASSKMGTRALNSLQKAISTVPDVMNERMNSDVTIRPLMDLSDVQNGVDEIHKMQNGLGEFALNTTATYNKALSTRASMNTGASDMNKLLKAVSGLKDDIGKNRGNSYVINGVNYSEGSKVSEAIGALVHAITVEGRA